jgi:hypothetical protein
MRDTIAALTPARWAPSPGEGVCFMIPGLARFLDTSLDCQSYVYPENKSRFRETFRCSERYLLKSQAPLLLPTRQRCIYVSHSDQYRGLKYSYTAEKRRSGRYHLCGAESGLLSVRRSRWKGSDAGWLWLSLRGTHHSGLPRRRVRNRGPRRATVNAQRDRRRRSRRNTGKQQL